MTFHPQTPQSPCRFSPVASLSDIMASHIPGPQPLATTLPTPAHSVNGGNSQPDAVMIDDSPHKRKRPLDDSCGDRDQKKMHLDVGELYLLCQKRTTSSVARSSFGQGSSRNETVVGLGEHLSNDDATSPVHPESLPRITEDLFEMFDLVDIAAEVAREKPNGEKNALRKTYKGHIKRLGVAGHFDVQKKEEDAPSDFLAMIQVPDLEWNVHQVKGREISAGLSETTHTNMIRALTMFKGPLPKAVWDTSVLGDLATANPDTSKSAASKPTAPNTPSASTPNAMGRSKSRLSPGHDPTRPRRSGKKRSYGDSSFEGYGEGFPDDDAGVDTGYSTGEGEGRQKRRKVDSGNSPQLPTMHPQSYGPGMVGA
ncbi:hypothetical protein G6O67_002881 [Ophiocordyceps sinensis]|uniref:Mediator of RNA polymerase II transcription subunit 19 n=2 Tax=Ophiocordyceps sinensis TaxID=72228 RepID=A0A8H4PV36_9HYPO|nr:Mediator of RNA polymerase II transcription subunit 19 [Ophiocordyceps sinensis CO18]KAF4511045.1 hypothetical protein G6O67_002881 [Ophiocordyceps sinensis]